MSIEKEIELIMWHFLVRLENMRKWGGSHSEFKRVTKSLPSHLASAKGKKLIEKAIKNLVNLGFIGIYKKSGEDHTSLNPKKAKEIKEFIKEVEESMKGNYYVK